MRVQQSTGQAHILRWPAYNRVPHENQRFSSVFSRLLLSRLVTTAPTSIVATASAIVSREKPLGRPLCEIRLAAGAWPSTGALGL